MDDSGKKKDPGVKKEEWQKLLTLRNPDMHRIAAALDIPPVAIKVTQELLITGHKDAEGNFHKKAYTKVVLDTHEIEGPHMAFETLVETLEQYGLKPVVQPVRDDPHEHTELTLRLEASEQVAVKLKEIADALDHPRAPDSQPRKKDPQQEKIGNAMREAYAVSDARKGLTTPEPDKTPSMPDTEDVARELVSENPYLKAVFKDIADSTGDHARMIASLYQALEFDVSPEYVRHDPAQKPLAEIRKELDYYSRRAPEFAEEARHAVLRELWDIAIHHGVQEEVRAMARGEEHDNEPFELTRRAQKPTSEFPPAEAGSEIRSIGKPEQERKSSPDPARGR